jgi:hypothetical protein
MSRIVSLLTLTVLATVSCISLASAISPATPEQILCGANYIFVGRAIEAVPVRQRPNVVADDKNGVNLAISVRRLTAMKEASSKYLASPILSAGDTVRAYTRVVVGPYSAPRFNHQGGLYFTGPYDSLVPDAVLKAAFTGEDFIYSASLDLNVDRPGSRAYVVVWPVDQQEWVNKTMAMYAKAGWPCSSPR